MTTSANTTIYTIKSLASYLTEFFVIVMNELVDVDETLDQNMSRGSGAARVRSTNGLLAMLICETIIADSGDANVTNATEEGVN
jgi:hypothetical protein